MKRLFLSLCCAGAPALAGPVAVEIDIDDVAPVATGVVARPGGRPGPCGPRDVVVLLRSDAERFLTDPASVPTMPLPTPTQTPTPTPTPTPTTSTSMAPASLRLPLWPGPGLFGGEADVFALAADAALAQAKVTTTRPTRLGWSKGAPALEVATSASVDDVQAALRAFSPTVAQVQGFERAVATARALAARTPGVRALERVDARLCLGDRVAAPTTTMSPAVVRAALAAPLMATTTTTTTTTTTP